MGAPGLGPVGSAAPAMACSRGTLGAAGTSMTVAGNLAFQSGAIYLVQINPSTSSFANVTGTATLNGATLNAVYASGSYVPKQYMVLSATGGVLIGSMRSRASEMTATFESAVPSLAMMVKLFPIDRPGPALMRRLPPVRDYIK